MRERDGLLQLGSTARLTDHLRRPSTPKYLIERDIYVTEDKITYVYISPNGDLVRKHARRGGFPADRVLEIATIIDPTTAESNELAAVAGG